MCARVVCYCTWWIVIVLFKCCSDPQKQPFIEGSWTLEPASCIYTTCQVLRQTPTETSLIRSHTLLQPQIGQVNVCVDPYANNHRLLYAQASGFRLNSPPLTNPRTSHFTAYFIRQDFCITLATFTEREMSLGINFSIISFLAVGIRDTNTVSTITHITAKRKGATHISK